MDDLQIIITRVLYPIGEVTKAALRVAAIFLIFYIVKLLAKYTKK